MEYEIHELIAAIEKLSDTSWYDSPFIIAIAAAIIGVAGAFSSAKFGVKKGSELALENFKTQQRIIRENRKIIACNEWVIRINQVFGFILGYKKSYFTKLSSDPLVRLQKVPIGADFKTSLKEEFHDIAFIVGCKVSDNNEELKWNEIERIQEMVVHYNDLCDLLTVRNQLYEDLNIKEYNVDKNGYSINFYPIIRHTELSINYIDNLLVEMESFLRNFPELVAKNIESDDLKCCDDLYYLGEVLNENNLKFMDSSIEVDYEKLSKYTGKDIDKLRIEFETGFEESFSK